MDGATETTAARQAAPAASSASPPASARDRRLPPGAYRMYPRGRPVVDAADAPPLDAAVAPVYEGFLPPQSREDVLRREAEEMLRAAITLDPSAVRRIDDDALEDPPRARAGEGDGAAREGTEDAQVAEGTCRQGVTSPISFILLTLLVIAGIVLGVASGGAGDSDLSSGVASGGARSDSDEESSSLATDYGGADASCLEDFPDRHQHARRLFADMTPAATLADAASPQRRALCWLVCRDLISAALIDGRDPATGVLPRQAHGAENGTDAGEAQVRRRYALAVFFYATSEDGPWTHRLNFLSPDAHECAWHHQFKRSNWPYGDWDPAGFACLRRDEETTETLVLSDADAAIIKMDLNFRVANNLTGTLPPELGYIDITHIDLETQAGLRGSLPATIGRAPLRSLAILFMAPHFGGVLPPSLLESPTMEWIAIKNNEGAFEFPPALGAGFSGARSRLLGLSVNLMGTGRRRGATRGMGGTVPSYLAELRSLQVLNLMGGSLEGTLPRSLGDLTSLTFLNLCGNALTGTLPPSLARLSRLDALVLGENRFSGPLPTWLGNMTGLRVLDLSYNRFEGTVPAAFSRLAGLEHVSLQRNKDLHGPITAFEPLQRLSSLLLHGNRFNSSLPVGLFSNFTGKIFADFGHNNFTGTLPPNFSRWAPNTTYLATMRNNFDAGGVGDAVCKQVSILHADCSSSSCSRSCCSEDHSAASDRACNYNLDFIKLTGLECDEWWPYCYKEVSRYDLEPVE